ncbi:MAG: hypothetical protein KJ645_05055, partial [Planctomycetes bacterium]|nr:hypothetical protein [Planctomycetota bacterium]
EDSPEMAARLLSIYTLLDPKGCKKEAGQCLENLMKRRRENHRWDDSPRGLAVDGEIVCALMDAAPLLGEKACNAAEQWLIAAFDLDHTGDLPDWPPLLEESRSQERPDLWIEGMIHAAYAASKYLAMKRPDHNPGAYLLALSVPQENILVRAEEMLKLAGPYLPPLSKIRTEATSLEVFWQKGGPFLQSVFVMCGTAPSEIQNTLIDTIDATLKEKGLSVRYMADSEVPFHAEPWDNAALYMTGCRYGIALLEGEITSPPAELLYQTGFMRGQGTPVLVLWDRSLQKEADVAFPGVRAPMTGIDAFGYDPKEDKLTSLCERLNAWADMLLKPDEGPTEQ